MCCRTVPKRTGPYQVWSFLARRTDQTDEHLHHTDHLDPNLPLWNVVQDLYSTGPAQETCDAAVGYAHYIRLSPTRQHELDHTDHTDQEYICPQRNRLSNRFYKKLKNVSCEYDRLNGWNSSLQAAWYIRHVRIILRSMFFVEKRQLSTTDWMVELNFASCVIRQTRSLGALVLCSICNMVFINCIYDMVVDTQFNKFSW